MKIVKQGAECQPIQEMDELTFVCSCGCEYKASIKNGEARLNSISPYPVFSAVPILYVYSSVCPCCGSICLYQGEPINYCCCTSDEKEIERLKKESKEAKTCREPICDFSHDPFEGAGW